MTDASVTEPLGAITTWLSGGTPKRSNHAYWHGAIPWISAATLKTTLIHDSDQRLTDAGVRAGSKLAPKGAVLVLVRGMSLHRETRIGLATRSVAFNQDVKALVPKPCVLPEFLVYALQARSAEIRGLVSSAGSGTGVLDTGLLKRLPVWLPSPDQQKSLIEPIRDAEKLVNALSALIVKKREMTQGIAEALISGEKRLPRLTGERIQIRLDTAGSGYGGLASKTKDDFGIGSARFVTFLDVINNVRVKGDLLEPVRVAPAERQNQVARADVLFNGSSETPEEVALAASVDFDPPVGTYLNSFCFGYRLADHESIDPTYLAYFFRSAEGRRLLVALAQGATRYNVSKRKVLQLAPEFPRIDEQRAIVSVLADCERELVVLEERRQKAEDVKQGLMQELLLGAGRPTMEAVA